MEDSRICGARLDPDVTRWRQRDIAERCLGHVIP